MKRIHTLFATLPILFISCMNTNNIQTDQGSKADILIDQKVDSLLALMTTGEKVGQLNMYNGTWEFTGPVPANDNSQDKAKMIKSGGVGAMINVLTAEGTRAAQRMAVENSRLGIPLLFGYDVIHGYKTMMPIPLAQAASWNPEVAKSGSQVAALEASAAGVHWTFAPMVDVSRDARWGRIMEGAGEDPYLTSVMAKAWIEGFQGDDLSAPHTIAACAKHYAAYGFAEAGRDYNTAEVSMSTLHNVILRPFKASSAAGAATFMNSFNDVNGVPATGSQYLLRDVLKGAWDYQGFVVSDWGSIKEMTVHGYSRDKKHAAQLALAAGSDMDMESKAYEEFTEELIAEGASSMEHLNDAVRRILKLKFQLGLFDDPYKYCNTDREKRNMLTAENMAVARDAARKSMVLLKNENDLLPLSKDVSSIAVIGQLAASKDTHLGNWRAQAIRDSGVSLLEGIRNAVSSQTKVTFSEGYKLVQGERSFIKELDVIEEDRSGFREAIALAKNSEVVVLAIGEDCFQSGEGRSQVDIGLKGTQFELLMRLLEVNKNVVVVLSNGRPLAIPEVVKSTPAILETWFLGSEAGNAIADVIFGDFNPEGKLPVSFSHHVGQEPFYYSQKSTGRPVPETGDYTHVVWSHYIDSPNEALFPFGFGLSYADFEYAKPNIAADGAVVNVSVNLTNLSDVEGTETVQVYIRDVYATEIQPIKRLVDFQKVKLAGGATQTVAFTLNSEDLGFYKSDGSFVAESGEFEIMVGGNSRDLTSETIVVNF